MTTAPQRLREIAVRLRKPRDGRPWGADDGAADLLDAIAAELEAPAADAAPVVAYLYEDEHGNQYLHQARNTAWIATPQPLIRQRDHIATVTALQARIDELEARWNLCSACNAEVGGSEVKPSWTDGIPDNLAAAAADAGEWLALIERCVQAGRWQFGLPDSMSRLRACMAQLDRHLSEDQPDTSKEQP